MDKVVLSKDEFVRVIAEHSDVPSDISRIMKYVESVFVLQNDESRPAYVFEVDLDNIDDEHLVILDRGLKYMKVTAILLPKKSITYLGEVTPQSLGIKGKIDAIRGRIKSFLMSIADYEEVIVQDGR